MARFEASHKSPNLVDFTVRRVPDTNKQKQFSLKQAFHVAVIAIMVFSSLGALPVSTKADDNQGQQQQGHHDNDNDQDHDSHFGDDSDHRGDADDNDEDKSLKTDFHFIKVVCPSYKDVAGNEKGDNLDASGGHFTDFSNYSVSDPHFPQYNASVNPSEIPQNCVRTSGWNFTISTDGDQQNNVSTVGPTDNNGEVVVAFKDLPSAEKTALKNNHSMWVSEVTQDSAAFGAIRCYKDALNGDNLEYIKFGQHAPKDVYCIAYNVAKPSTTQTTFHFIKEICPSYSDIVGNGTADNADDTGGNFTQFSNYSASVPNFPSVYPNKPVNPLEIPKNCSPARGWNFNIADNGSMTGSTQVGPTDGTGTVDVTLNNLPANVQSSLTSGGSMWVTEATQPNVASFGTLRCYNDALNGDNLDYVSLGSDQSNYPKDVYCIAYNVDKSARPTTADLSISKGIVTDDATPLTTEAVNVGDSVNFVVKVTNNGPDTANGVTVNDLLPAGLTFVSSNPSQGSYNSNTGVWTVGTLANGASATMYIQVTVNGRVTCKMSNIATVVSGDSMDSNNQNNTDSATVTIIGNSDSVCQADLSVTKKIVTDDPNPSNTTSANPGDTVNFAVTVTNNGPDAANGVTVNDLLPAGLTFVSSNPSQGSYDSNTGVWTVGSLANGASATLYIQVTVSLQPFCQMVNTASVSHSDASDPNSENNSASATVNTNVDCGGNPTPTPSPTPTPPSADLSLSKKIVDDNSPSNTSVIAKPGDQVNFVIKVTNNGPDAAAFVTVNDALPAGLTYVSDNGAGAYNSGTNVWTVGSLANGASASLFLTVTVDQDASCTLVNTASVSSQTPDLNLDNNLDSATVNLSNCADVAVTKTVGDLQASTSANVNDTEIFTITAKNNGPSDAANVVVTDLLPTGLTYISDDGAGAYNNVNGLWTIGALLNGTSKTLHITTAVGSNQGGKVITNTATVKSDKDSNGSNDSSSATVNVNSNGCIESCGGGSVDVADPAIVKTLDNGSPVPGATIQYTITVTNGGSVDATGVVVTDPLPSTVTYVSNDVSAAYDAGTKTVTWTIGTVHPAQTLVMHVTATVNGAAGGSVANTATLTTSGSNSNTSNDTGSVSGSIVNPSTGGGGSVNNNASGAPCNNGCTIGGGNGGGQVAGDSTTVPNVGGVSPDAQVLGASTSLPRTGMPVTFMFLVLAALLALLDKKLKLV